jgi:hypothetical protein
MNTQHTAARIHVPYTQTPIPYELALAASLVLFARSHSGFAQHLKELVFPFRAPLYRESQNDKEIYIDPRIGILTLANEESAAGRALWLSKRLLSENSPEHITTARFLSQWADDQVYESPKQLVVGFIVVAVPGFTLGKYRIKRKLSIIIRDGLAARTDTEQTEKAAKVSLRFVRSAIHDAKNIVQYLEPETAEWFFDDQKIELFTSPREHLHTIKDSLEYLHIPHAIEYEDLDIGALAITPAANGDYLETQIPIEKISTS